MQPAPEGADFYSMTTGNGVSKEFWSEVLDLKAPVDDDRGGRRQTRRKKQVRLLVRRSGR
jgi:hypothetical protein